MERSWRNYLEFEVQPELVDPERYRRVLDELISRQPFMEYFGGRFRRKFDRTSSDLDSQIRLRASCVVRRLSSDFDWDEFVDFTSDFLLLEDCILLGPDNRPVKGISDSRLWVYAVFGNTPLLIEHSQYELRLGATAAVRHRDLVFVADTEGLYPTEYLGEHTRKISPDELGRIFSKVGTTPKEVSLLNSWPAGPAVKSSTLHADNLSETPAQLSDAVFVCSTARANVKSRGNDKDHLVRRHYVGFQRGRLSEELRSTERSEFSLREFVSWTNELAHHICANDRKLPDFFGRYLLPVAPPGVVIPRYLVLNLFGAEIEIETEDGHAIELTDSIVEVQVIPDTSGNSLRFECDLGFRELGAGGPSKTAKVILTYEPGAARFRLKSTSLNSEIFVFEQGKEDSVGLLTYLNNNDESFTIALREPEIFYTAQSFYRVDYAHAEARLAGILQKWPPLETIDTEKGRTGSRKTKWDAGSIFDLIDSSVQSGLVLTNFGPREFLFCDDLNKEPADFVCANFGSRKIAFIHAKQGTDHSVSASALHVVVAQALKNLGLISRGGELPAHLNRWNRQSTWPGTNIRRWRFGGAGLPERSLLWAKIRSEILDHPEGTREVWLILGRTLDKDELLEQLRDPELRDAVTGQVVHLLSSLNASCIQLGVRLRVFCH